MDFDCVDVKSWNMAIDKVLELIAIKKKCWEDLKKDDYFEQGDRFYRCHIEELDFMAEFIAERKEAE